MFELIRQLVNLYGATGREAGVADAVEALVKDHVDSIRRDALGNLICEKRGTDPDGKRIMLSAHMDHIGFIVVAVEKEGCEPYPSRQLPKRRAGRDRAGARARGRDPRHEAHVHRHRGGG